MRMRIFFTFLLLLAVYPAISQTRFFEETKANDVSSARESVYISKFSLFRIHTEQMKNYLKNAPLEFTAAVSGAPLEVPLPDGTNEVFDMYESPVLAPNVAEKHPEIKTYAGKGRQHPHYSIRINFTINGFSGIITGVKDDAVYFEKWKDSVSPDVYKRYFARDAVSPATRKIHNANNRCGALDRRLPPVKKGENGRVSAATSTGSVLRTFKLAMAASAEFTANKGGTQLAAFNALTNYVNNLNAVYRKELSVSFMLVTDESLVFTNAATDPYTNDDQDAMLGQNQATLDSAIGNANYHIGHVLGYTGGSGGGLGVNPSVCDDATKAQGVSGVGDGSYAEVFDFQLIAHEIGHQFGMSHTYNSHIPVCTTRAFGTSVEPGSGTTIMSYGFTCNNDGSMPGLTGNDDYETPYAPFLHFHAVSLDQANAYISTLSCFTGTSTGNAAPTLAAMTAAYSVPRSTPFSLAGLASDANPGDILSYSWEGTNVSNEPDKSLLTASTLADATLPPFFRSYTPVQSNESNDPGRRYYPRLSAILDGSNYARGDKLPSIGTTTTHRLTVRDNQGGVVSGDVTVQVDGNSGPFLVTDDPAGVYPGNSPLSVKWSVNGTTEAPISCKLVDILLSTDGGYTFPIILAAAVPNSGVASVVLPNISTTTARVKVAPGTSMVSGNMPGIFFDISNQNFSIETATPVRLLSFQVSQPKPGTALLSWKTSEEKNNLGFYVEMSNDSRMFEQAGFRSGTGNLSVNQYQYAVENLLAGTYYFRLKQMDLDGVYAYSPIRSLQVSEDQANAVSLYPNPVRNKIRIGDVPQTECQIQILDQSGRLAKVPVFTRSNRQLEMDVSTLPSGLYVLKLVVDGMARNLKFVKL